MKPCIFSQNGQHPFRYDVCRSCTSYTEGCNNYLGEYKYSKPIDTRKSPSKSAENAELGGVEHSVELRGTQRQYTSPAHCESYSRVVLLQNVRSILEPFLPRPNFLERFRRSQR